MAKKKKTLSVQGSEITLILKEKGDGGVLNPLIHSADLEVRSPFAPKIQRI